jgi:hypothetical protein
MADIHIQKKRTPVWPWLLLLLLIVLIVIFFILNERRDDGDHRTTVVTTDTLNYGGPDRWMAPVDEYNAFVSDTVTGRRGTPQDGAEAPGTVQNDTTAGGNLQRDDYISRGFFLLSAALDAIIKRDTSAQAGNLRDRNDTLRARSEAIYNETTTRGANIRSAAMAAVNVMEQLQKQNNQADLQGDVKEARQSAERINAKANENQMRDQVKRFFAESNDVIQKYSASNRAYNTAITDTAGVGAGSQGGDTINRTR